MTRLLMPWLKSCMNESGIDWSGRYPLTHTGAIDEQKARDMGLSVSSSIRCVPIVPKESDQYQQLLEAVYHARRLLKPASSAEAGFELKRLSVWCPMQQRDIRDFKLMLHDALNDLAEYPLDLIQQACARYRNNPDQRNDFFPRPGRLKALVEHKLVERRRMLYRLERLLAVANEPPKLPPPLTLDELEQRAKHRLGLADSLCELMGKKVEELPPAEAHKRFVFFTEEQIHEALAGKHLTKGEAEALLSSLHSRYPEIFHHSNEEKHDGHQEEN